MAKLTERQRELLENPFVGTATTLRSDGSPHNKLAKKYLDRTCTPATSRRSSA